MQYPSPESLELPAVDATPEQETLAAWKVQHNRAWLAFWIAAAVGVLAIIGMIVQTAKYKPAIKYVTLDGGYVAIWNEGGNAVIDGVEYVPARLRAVVTSYVENRYAYDWQNLDKIRNALNLMQVDAAAQERQKIKDLSPAQNIVASRLKVDLKLDYSKLSVVAQGKGTFQVTLGGEARINDLVRYPDPSQPLRKPVEMKLVVQSVAATDLNPLGYVVISTGKDPIL